MGWLTMPGSSMGGHATAKAYLDAQFTYTRKAEDGSAGLRVLASSCPQNRTYYAAVQVKQNDVGGAVFAVVCKVLWNPNRKTGEQFGYKDMDESMGPCEDNCPRRILDLLTPTESEHAIDWSSTHAPVRWTAIPSPSTFACSASMRSSAASSASARTAAGSAARPRRTLQRMPYGRRWRRSGSRHRRPMVARSRRSSSTARISASE